MQETDPVSELRTLLTAEESRVKRSVGDGDRRMALFELVRSMDAYFFYLLCLDPQASKRELQSDRYELTKNGWNKALSLFADEGARGVGVPLAASTTDPHAWADSLIQHCGRIGSCELALDLVRYGLAKLTSDGNDAFVFDLPPIFGPLIVRVRPGPS
ncbi:MAG: hypothetical protein WEB52_14035, partial [Dehalococcoidia bacterium]